MSSASDLDEQRSLEGNKTPRKKRLSTIVRLLFVIICFAIIAVILLYFSGNNKPSLVQQVESSGFTSVTYFKAENKVVASATAKYGQCVVRFVSTTQPVSDNSRVARLALVRDDGSFIYDPTPAKLGQYEAFKGCGK